MPHMHGRVYNFGIRVKIPVELLLLASAGRAWVSSPRITLGLVQDPDSVDCGSQPQDCTSVEPALITLTHVQFKA